MNARHLLLPAMIGAAALLAGCGLAETGAAAAAGGVSKTQEIKEGLKNEQKVKDGIAAADAVGKANLEAAEKASQ
jgi:hypothetical protein